MSEYVSTGRLPPAEDVQAWLEEAHARFAANASTRARHLSRRLGLDLLVSRPA